MPKKVAPANPTLAIPTTALLHARHTREQQTRCHPTEVQSVVTTTLRRAPVPTTAAPVPASEASKGFWNTLFSPVPPDQASTPYL